MGGQREGPSPPRPLQTPENVHSLLCREQTLLEEQRFPHDHRPRPRPLSVHPHLTHFGLQGGKETWGGSYFGARTPSALRPTPRPTLCVGVWGGRETWETYDPQHTFEPRVGRGQLTRAQVSEALLQRTRVLGDLGQGAGRRWWARGPQNSEPWLLRTGVRGSPRPLQEDCGGGRRVSTKYEMPGFGKIGRAHV